MARSRPTRPIERDVRPSLPAAGLLTTQEAAALLRVHPKQVYRLFARGLPHRRVGSEWRYDRDELLAWAGGPTTGAPSASPPPLVASNGDVVVGMLLRAASAPSSPAFGAVVADREVALGLLRTRAVLAAGFHGTSFPAEVPEGRLARLHLVRREVGLVAPRGTTPSLAQATQGRLATRPSTAGVRRILDEALRGAGVSLARVKRRSTEYESHPDVVCAVARGDAELGIATAAWAHRLGLGFLRLAVEDYGLLFFASSLGEPLAVRLCEAAQSAAFRQGLAEVPGYDAEACGRIQLDPTRGADGIGAQRRD